MPKIPVDECPAGPALDATVAEALGLKTKWFEYADSKMRLCLVGKTASGNVDWRSIPAYSTDIAAAWGLWDADMTIHRQDGQCHCILSPEYGLCMELLLSKASAVADTAPLAICRAFLKANGVEYVEVPGDGD